jgi:septal ring factor EnvC (AmiA/AmiB activator)
LRGLTGVTVEVGAEVRRGESLGVLAESVAQGEGLGQGRLQFGVSLDGRALDPGRYLLPT